MKRSIEAELLSGEALYRAVVLDKLLHARESVDISSANVKAMFVADGPARGRRGPDHKSIVEQFSKLAARGVRLRLLHAETPSRPFRQAFDAESRLVQGGLALRLCPRVHFKTVIVDGAWIYLGSANLTGAGLGAKGEHKRNFELGFVTEDFDVIDRTQALFEAVWSGAECGPCKVRELCPDPQGESTIVRGRRSRGGKPKGGAGSLVQLGKSRRFGR
jgi:phosphatidylserine/phosphatidylglycerophosphate/cardiolipin synthase-like enzyme